MDNDAAIKRAQARINSRARDRDKEIDHGLESIMTQPNGRRLVYWLLSLGRVGQNPYAGNALATAFNCGELNTAQKLQERVLGVASDFYVKMLTEMEDERRADAAELAAARADSDASDADE